MNQEAIRQSADARWEAQGRPDGQHDRHWFGAEQGASGVETPQTWSADHGGGVSPPTSTGSVEDEQVEEPANDWPAADGGEADTSDAIPALDDKLDGRDGSGQNHSETETPHRTS